MKQCAGANQQHADLPAADSLVCLQVPLVSGIRAPSKPTAHPHLAAPLLQVPCMDPLRQKQAQMHRARGVTQALADPTSSGVDSAPSSNPLDSGPCGDVLSKNSTCWVRNVLIWGAVAVGLSMPIGVLWLGDEVGSFLRLPPQ